MMASIRFHAEDEALGELEEVLAAGDGPVRLDDTGDLVISPLTAEDVPDEARALKAELTEMRFAPIVSQLIELDKRTGYLDCFTHAGGKQTRTPELKRNLIAVLLAHSTNLGLTRMADACGISYDVFAWTSEWYVREETLHAANLAIIDYHQRLPLTAVEHGPSGSAVERHGVGPAASTERCGQRHGGLVQREVQRRRAHTHR
ncbi:Tn3 family transposase [Amycolatopsis sp. cmx-11-32]|uniref:Tn3 family transposase n=1 Tax=Amycolatopsis sp. cmx-11-32 TaxID=2785796 RepID=UPI0039E28DB7